MSRKRSAKIIHLRRPWMLPTHAPWLRIQLERQPGLAARITVDLAKLEADARARREIALSEQEGHRMTCFEARFGSSLCHVDIEARPTLGGGPVYTAQPFVFDEKKHVLRWFPSAKGHPVELEAGSEADVLERAARFLEQRLGPQAGAFQPAPDRKSPLVMEPLREGQ